MKIQSEEEILSALRKKRNFREIIESGEQKRDPRRRWRGILVGQHSSGVNFCKKLR
jgi:hypothetical protein